MNLSWDASGRRFIAEFSQDFSGDLAAVKEAGFKPDTSSGGWIWHTSKAGPLTKLRSLRPGLLTISPEARTEYLSLSTMEEKNAKIKAEAAEHNKVSKKKQKIKEQIANAIVIPEKGYIDASDLPPCPPPVDKYVPPPPPDTRCIICKDPVYFYEKADPPMCLYCEKITLDFSDQVC